VKGSILTLMIISLLISPNLLMADRLVVAIEDADTAPYLWRDRNGDIEGFLPALYSKLIAQTGHEVDFVFLSEDVFEDWPGVIADLDQGKYQLFGPTLIPESVKNQVSIGEEPFVVVRMGVYYVPDRAFEVTSLESLFGKRGIGFGGGRADNEESSIVLPGLNLVYGQRGEDFYNLLNSGKADYWFNPKYISNAYILSRGLRDKLVAADFQLDIPLYLAGGSDERSKAILAQLDALIVEYRNSGQYQRLMSYYQNEYIKYYRGLK